MGIIREPEGIDFLIQSQALTKKQEKELSEFIAMRKVEIIKLKSKGKLKKNLI
jgi:hypothetical protein